MMNHNVKICWKRKPDESFSNSKYSRAHTWQFDGGITVPASSSPQVVPLPFSDESAVDPEEAFIGAIASCHMLFFLSIAAAHHYTVDLYEDAAVGTLEKNEAGVTAMSTITLKPLVRFSGQAVPTGAQIARLHQQAHGKCYLANSIKTKINIIQS